MKKKMLYISAFNPSVNTQAGQKTTFHNINKLSNEYSITLLVVGRMFISKTSKSFLKISNRINIVQNPIDYLITALLILLLLPIRLGTRISTSVIRHLIFNQRKYNLIYLDYSQMFWCIFFIKKNINIHILCHYIIYQYAHRSKNYNKISLYILYIYERYFFRNATTITVQSQKDKKIIIRLFKIPSRKVNVTNPFLSEFTYSIVRSEKKIIKHSLLFWGSMDRSENYQSIILFINKIFPKIILKYPNAKLMIVGRAPHYSLMRSIKDYSNNIYISGYTENPEKYFESADIGIAPLIAGAGIKVKVLEMLNAKIPVVSTRIGAEGIPNNDLLHVARDIDSMYNCILRLWN